MSDDERMTWMLTDMPRFYRNRALSFWSDNDMERLRDVTAYGQDIIEQLVKVSRNATTPQDVSHGVAGAVNVSNVQRSSLSASTSDTVTPQGRD